jgi:hypothetical protein
MDNQINIIEIIRYLDNNIEVNEVNNNEKIKYDILEKYNSINFKKFNNFFKGNIDRIGTLHDENSIFFSLLYVLFDSFKTIDNLKQNILINQLKKKIINDNSNDKNLIISSLSDFFNVNIILFSYSKDDILIFYKDEELIPYKNNIFINEFNNNYYPLVYKNNGGNTFKYNSTILKEILNYNKLSVYSPKSDKKFKVNYNNYVDILDKSFNIKLLDDIENILQDSDPEEHNNSIEISDDKDFNNSSEKICLLNLSDEIKNVNEKITKNNDSILKDEIIYKIKTSTNKKLEKETKDTLQSYVKLIFSNKKDINLNAKKSMLVNYLKENII